MFPSLKHQNKQARVQLTSDKLDFYNDSTNTDYVSVFPIDPKCSYYTLHYQSCDSFFFQNNKYKY